MFHLQAFVPPHLSQKLFNTFVRGFWIKKTISCEETASLKQMDKIFSFSSVEAYFPKEGIYPRNMALKASAKWADASNEEEMAEVRSRRLVYIKRIMLD